MFEKLGNAFSNVAKSLGEKELKEQDIDVKSTGKKLKNLLKKV